MKIYTLLRRQTIVRPRRDVFKFFEKPENLAKITPNSVGFNILTPGPIIMKTGTVLDYTIRLFGFIVRWTTLISEYDPPNRFCDVAIRGPYSFWHHTHIFEENEHGTNMTDEVRYALPFNLIGRIIHFLWVRRQLDRIFDYRGRMIREMLEGHDAATSANNDSEDRSAGV